MLFEVRLTMSVDAIDQMQVEIIALGALQAAKAHVREQAVTVTDSAVAVSGGDE